MVRIAAGRHAAVPEPLWRLVEGWFVCEPLEGQPGPPGVSRPVPGYRVLRASGAQSRFEAVGPERLTPWSDARRR